LGKGNIIKTGALTLTLTLIKKDEEIKKLKEKEKSSLLSSSPATVNSVVISEIKFINLYDDVKIEGNQ
jgi:hypothetical protein